MQALNLVLVLGGHITLGVFQCLQASTSLEVENVEVIPLKVADTEHVGTGSYLLKLIKSSSGLRVARRICIEVLLCAGLRTKCVQQPCEVAAVNSFHFAHGKPETQRTHPGSRD